MREGVAVTADLFGEAGEMDTRDRRVLKGRRGREEWADRSPTAAR
jgi:hypothetical protein